MKRFRLISVVGGAECSPEEASFAEEAGRLIAKAGLGIVCGGRTGVMEAVCRGAWSVGGFTLGILPSSHADEGNQFLSVVIPSGLGEARNVLVVLAGEAVLAVGGRFGTLSEIAYALRSGKPVVGYRTWTAGNQDFSELPVHRVESPDQALSMISALVGVEQGE